MVTITRRAGSATRTTVFHLVSSVLAILFLFPLVWAVLSSFKSPAEADRMPPTFLPKSLSLGNYANLADYGNGILTYTMNSLVAAALTVVLTVVVCVLAGMASRASSFAVSNRCSL